MVIDTVQRPKAVLPPHSSAFLPTNRSYMSGNEQGKEVGEQRQITDYLENWRGREEIEEEALNRGIMAGRKEMEVEERGDKGTLKCIYRSSTGVMADFSGTLRHLRLCLAFIYLPPQCYINTNVKCTQLTLL